VGILGSLLGRRERVVQYRTIDGGHPAPYPDMTDEQLYNYEVTFNVPHRTFDKPPHAAKRMNTPGEGSTIRREAPFVPEISPDLAPEYAPRAAREARSQRHGTAQKTMINEELRQDAPEKVFDAPRYTATARTEANDELVEVAAEPLRQIQLPPLDLAKPVRLITTKQPVEIITTRARHPVYKVHAYIGNDDVVTLFTLEGQLSENGPRYLENVPQRQQLYLNIYPNPDARGGERFLITQHATKQDAEAAAKPGRVACAPVQFDL